MKRLFAIIIIVTIIFIPCLTVNALESSTEINEQYTIYFNTNGGSNVDSQTILENNTISKPNDPIKDGYIFDGWYLDSNFNNKYDFNTNIHENKIIYAKWIESIKITYDLNGGIPTDNYKESVIVPKSNNKININDLKNNICNTPNGYAFIGLEVNGNKYNINNTKYITLTTDSHIKFLWNKVINEVRINLTKPYVGESTSIEKNGNDWNWEKPYNVPKVSSNDSSYKVVESYWVTGFNKQGLDTPFIGTFESGKSYYAEIYIEASDGYQFNDLISVLVNGQNIDSLILMENNSSQYGTSYMSVGKIITPIENNISKIETKDIVINTNNDKIDDKKVEDKKIDNKTREFANEIEDKNTNKFNLSNLSTNVNHLQLNNKLSNNLKISSVDNVSTSSNLYIWYTIAILSIIGLSAIYIKNTY